LKRLLVQRSGTAAIEFVIVLPVFVLLTAGILGFGVYFGTAHSVQQLSADAARASVAGLTAEERLSLAKQHVASSADNYPLLRADRLIVTGSDTSGRFALTVGYDASHTGIWELEGLVPLPSSLIERHAVIKHGGE